MMTNKKYVFDTNTLVSAVLFSKSKPAQSLEKGEKNGLLARSSETFSELIDVLQRPKFDKYLSREVRLTFINRYEELAKNYDISHIITACRDERDNKFLELALSANASCIISGDDDLLVLHPFNDIPILNPADFLL